MSIKPIITPTMTEKILIAILSSIKLKSVFITSGEGRYLPLLPIIGYAGFRDKLSLS
jgi:hypothetical protein